MKIDRDKLKDKSYLGVDINLSGFGLAALTYDGIHLNFVEVKKQVSSINVMFREWHAATKDLYRYVEGLVGDTEVLVCIEDPTGMEQKAWQTAAILNRLIGMISFTFIELKYECRYPSSVIWKKKVIGDGKAEKKVIQAAMGELLFPGDPYGYIENHHLADGCGLAMHGYLEDLEEEEDRGCGT